MPKSVASMEQTNVDDEARELRAENRAMARAVQQLCEKVELVIKTNEESRSHFDQLLQIHAEGRRQMEQLIQAHAESQEHTKNTQEQILASQGKLLEEMHNASDKRGQEQEESAIRELREKLMERLPRSQASPVQQPAGAATQQSAANPTNFVAGESSAPRAPAREPYRAPHLRNENTHRGDAHFRDNNGRQNGLGGQTNARQAHFEEDLEHEGSPAGAARVQTNLFPNLQFGTVPNQIPNNFGGATRGTPPHGGIPNQLHQGDQAHVQPPNQVHPPPAPAIEEYVRNGQRARKIPEYRTPYPSYIDHLYPFPRGFKYPEFSQFSGDDNRSTVEHVGKLTAQCQDLATNDFWKLRLFGQSLTGTAFSWYI